MNIKREQEGVNCLPMHGERFSGPLTECTEMRLCNICAGYMLDALRLANIDRQQAMEVLSAFFRQSSKMAADEAEKVWYDYICGKWTY